MSERYFSGYDDDKFPYDEGELTGITSREVDSRRAIFEETAYGVLERLEGKMSAEEALKLAAAAGDAALDAYDAQE